MPDSSRYLGYPLGLLGGAVSFMALAASLLPGTNSVWMLLAGRAVATLVLLFVGLCNFNLVNYLIAISARDDTHHHRPTAIALSAALFVALICFYAGIFVAEMPNSFAVDVGAGFSGCIVRTIRAFYFSSITISTVGYGEIHPEGVFDQLTAAAEAVNGLIAFGVFTGALTGFVSTKAGAK